MGKPARHNYYCEDGAIDSDQGNDEDLETYIRHQIFETEGNLRPCRFIAADTEVPRAVLIMRRKDSNKTAGRGLCILI